MKKLLPPMGDHLHYVCHDRDYGSKKVLCFLSKNHAFDPLERILWGETLRRCLHSLLQPMKICLAETAAVRGPKYWLRAG
jgi:hypothetical protein